MKKKLPNGWWLMLFFLPGFLAAVILLTNPDLTYRISPEIIYGSSIVVGCYLSVLSFVYGRRNNQRGLELALSSLVMTLGLFTANFVVCGVVYLVGCVCAVSELGRINR